VAIIFPTTFALVIVHGPKMMAFLSSSVRGKNSKNSRGGGGESREPGTSHHDSHTARRLQAFDGDKEKSLVVMEDVHPARIAKPIETERVKEKSVVVEITPQHKHKSSSLSGIRRIEEAKFEDEIPANSWRVLPAENPHDSPDPATSWRVLPAGNPRDSPENPRDSPTSGFGEADSNHPLFGNYPNQAETT